MSTTAKAAPDRVLVREGGVERELSITEFVGLPLTRRVRYLLAGEAEFFAGGSRLDTAEALRCVLEQGAHGVHAGKD